MRVQDAVIAAEDRSFWTEGGISPTGILRAAYDDVTSSGGSLSGGSTITQEFVRNYYERRRHPADGQQEDQGDLHRAEAGLSASPSSGSCTNYLNLIYLGNNSYGVAAAAETYFGVPVSKLTVAQDAVIAAIIQQPSLYPLLSVPGEPHRPLALRAQRHGADGRHHPGAGEHHEFPKLLTDSGLERRARRPGSTSTRATRGRRTS